VKNYQDQIRKAIQKKTGKLSNLPPEPSKTTVTRYVTRIFYPPFAPTVGEVSADSLTRLRSKAHVWRDGLCLVVCGALSLDDWMKIETNPRAILDALERVS
jgi:hypothetical protein